MRNDKISINFVKPYLVKTFLNNKAKCGEIELYTDKNITKFTISIKNFSYMSHDKLATTINDIRISFTLRDLLRLNINSPSIIINQAHINIPLDLIIKGNNTKPPRSIPLIYTLRNISVIDSTISVYDKKQELIDTLVVSGHLNDNFNDKTGKITFKNNHNNTSIHLSSKYNNAKNKLHCFCDIYATNSKLLNSIFPTDITVKEIKTKIHYAYFIKDKKHYAKVSGYIPRILLNIDINQQDIRISEITFSGNTMDTLVTINKIEFNYQDHPINVTGSGYINNNLIKLQANIKTADIDIANLNRLWPSNVISPVRKWVISSIKNGKIHNSSVAIDIAYNTNNNSLQYNNLKGQFALQNINISYLDTMPLITNFAANVYFDSTKFNLNVISGKSNRLLIKQGQINIGNLSDPQAHLDLKLNLDGKLADMLSLINHKPLAYANKYGLDPNKSSGTVNANLTMDMPVSLPFNADKITTNLNAQITNFSLQDVTPMKLKLTNGNCTLAVAPSKTTLRGTANIKNNKLTIDIGYDQSKDSTSVEINTLLNQKLIQDLFSPNIPDIIEDNCKINLKYLKAKDINRITIYSNITNIGSNFLFYNKPKNEHAEITSQILLGKENHIMGHSTIITSNNDWNIKLKSHKVKNQRNAVSLSYTHNKQNHLECLIQNTNNFSYNIDLNCKFIDLSLLKQISSSPTTLDKSFNVTARIGKLHLGGAIDLYKNILSFNYTNQLNNMKYHASILPNNNKAHKINASLITKGKLRTIKIQSNGGGETLKAFNIFNNIEGGDLKIYAEEEYLFNNKEWFGKAKLSNFTLHNVPFVTKLFSLISPTGIIDLANNNGTLFTSAKMIFGVAHNHFKILASRSHGASLGIILDGKIKLIDDQSLQLSGSVIPAYLLNNLLSNIPILGNILAGGKNGGLFAISFSIGGNIDSPKIFSNPFSALTPGIIKNILPNDNDNYWYKDKWINDDQTAEQSFNNKF